MSVRKEQLDSHWKDFHEILYFKIYRKSVEKIQVFLKSEKNNSYSALRPLCIHGTVSMNSN
jgi:hypothetical protein